VVVVVVVHLRLLWQAMLVLLPLLLGLLLLL
jgi:hypothetical protein